MTAITMSNAIRVKAPENCILRGRWPVSAADRPDNLSPASQLFLSAPGCNPFFPWQHGNGYMSVPLKSQTLY